MDTLVFFCDIRGTITSKDGEATIEKLQLLLDSVYDYALSINCQKVIFSLISSDSKLDVLSHYERLIKLDSNVEFGKQFYANGCFYAVEDYLHFENKNVKLLSKIGLIKEYVDEIKQEKNIKALCYADDANNKLYDQWLNRLYEDLDIYNIKPSSDKCNDVDGFIETNQQGIDGVLDCLDSLTNKNKVRAKI